ncbi:MAG: hypothetical protein HY671_10440 [Chloroflexi bacterium]|nr:hypothetical protein [Chloroflexota bacterium]
MSDLELDFQNLVEGTRDALAKQGIRLDLHEYGKRPGMKYSFTGPKNFAWVTKKPSLHCLAVGTRQEWADEAGVSDYQFKPKTMFGGPGAHWRIAAGDSVALTKMVIYLVKICKARHL